MMANPKLTCIIADDEPMALQLLENYVLKTPFLELKTSCENAFEVLNFLQNNPPVDLIFTDIQMPELSGMELSKTLPQETKVIFTTAFDHYAIEGYKVNALGYLLKPFSYQEFLDAALKAKNWFGQTSSVDSGAKNHQPDFFFVKSEYKQIKIDFENILYIEGLKDYVKIYLSTEDKPILSLMTMKKLEEELPKNKFMRVHRSYIVALDKIEQVERNQLIINKQRINISEAHREVFRKFKDDNLLL